MVIEKITIGHFGGVKDYECSFTDGINLIEGRNEAGKTTIGTFIKFIFFGLSSKTKGGSLSERRKYQSWDTESAEGSLEFSHRGNRYRIERSLSPSGKSGRSQGRESVKIIDLETGTECLEGEDPGRYFFGVTDEVFCQTAFVGQADGGKIDGSLVGAAIENMLFAGDETISTKQATKKLEEGRTMLLYKNKKGGRIYDLQIDKEKLARRLEVARSQQETIISCEAEKNQLEEDLQRSKEATKQISEKLERAEASRQMEGYRRLKALESVYREKEVALDAQKQVLSHDAFLPDEHYVSMLEESQREIAYTEAALDRAVNNVVRLGGDRLDQADRVLLKQAQEDGGAEGVAERIDQYRHMKKVSGILGGFFVFLMVLWLALGAVFFLLPSVSRIVLAGNITMREVGLAFGGLAVLMLLVGIIFFVRGRKFTDNIRELIASYGALTEEDLYAHIRSSEKRRDDQRVYEQKKADAEKDVQQMQQQLNAQIQVADRLLMQMGRSYSAQDDLSAAASEARKIMRTISDALAEVKEAKAAVDAVRSTLNGQSEEALESILARTESAGDVTEEELSDLRADYEAVCAENERLQSEIHNKKIELTKLTVTAENPASIADSISEKDALLAKLSLKHDALRLACDSIERAADSLRRNVAPKLSGQASTLMRKSTAGKYETIGVNDKLDMEYGAQNPDSIGYTTRDIDFMSAGTRDLAYISLRLALVGLLFHKSQPPMFFDESFARLDDDRLACMFGLLREYAAGSSQIFLFTSQHRDAQILAGQGEFNHIKLS